MAIFITGTSYFVADMSTNLGIPVNTSYNTTYNKIDDVIALSNNATAQLQGGDVDSSFNEALQIASFPVLKMVMNSFSISVSIIESLFSEIGLPDWLLGMVLCIVSVGLIFAVVNAFFGRNT